MRWISHEKLIRVLVLPVLFSTDVALLPGCGGGNSGSLNSPARFAGTYNGTFSGATTQNSPRPGVPVSGTFTVVADRNGDINGTLSQPGVGNFSLSGTVENDGTLLASAVVGTNQQATLRGTIATKLSVTSITGTKSGADGFFHSRRGPIGRSRQARSWMQSF